MEPIQQTENKSKKAKIIIIVLILLALIGILFMLQTKTEAPANINQEQVANQEESQQLNNDIDSATTFDNESDLQAIDKEF